MATGYDGVKVFSATTAQRRSLLGESVTEWLQANPGVTPTKATVLQSSDEAHHCITVVVYWKGKLADELHF